MSFLKEFFGESKPSGLEEFANQMQDMCRHESNTNDCSLVQQLKQKQAEKRELDAKIKNFNDDGISNIPHFVEFLMDMERQGFQMERDQKLTFYGSRIYYEFVRRFGVGKLEVLLAQTTDEELRLMFEELSNLKHKSKVISGLRENSARLGREITELKAKLGIE